MRRKLLACPVPSPPGGLPGAQLFLHVGLQPFLLSDGASEQPPQPLDSGPAQLSLLHATRNLPGKVRSGSRGGLSVGGGRGHGCCHMPGSLTQHRAHSASPQLPQLPSGAPPPHRPHTPSLASGLSSSSWETPHQRCGLLPPTTHPQPTSATCVKPTHSQLSLPASPSPDPANGVPKRSKVIFPGLWPWVWEALWSSLEDPMGISFSQRRGRREGVPHGEFYHIPHKQGYPLLIPEEQRPHRSLWGHSRCTNLTRTAPPSIPLPHSIPPLGAMSDPSSLA